VTARVLLALLSTAVPLAVPAGAHELTAGPVVIGHPWAQPEGAASGYAFLTVRNTGAAPDRLVSTSVPPEVARAAALRTYAVDGNGVEILRRAEAVDLPAGAGPVRLAVRLQGSMARLAEGGSFPLTLSFERSGKITVDVTVEKTPGHGAAPDWSAR
jgi:periplasmic copper chaperone A